MAKKKAIHKVIKLQIKGGQANPAPPIGPALGAAGVNIMEACKQLNAATQQDKGKVIPVVITVFADKSFTFVLKKSPMAEMLKKAAGIEKGSAIPNRDKVARLTVSQLEEVAKEKMADLNARKLESAVNIVAGTARSMGIEIQEA